MEKKPAGVPGLRYSTDGEPGIHRVRRGTAFAFRDASGRPVRDRESLARFRRLVIPPAWESVWICRDDRGHLQVTGRDARGRKQYRYHARWRETRDEGKFDRLAAFGRALPGIRRKVREHLALPGLPREKVLALIVRLLDLTAIRVGNERYVDENDSFGLTTLRNRHVRLDGSRIAFDFKGKSGKLHRVLMEDPRLASLIKHCRDLPGYELFQYVDDAGKPAAIDSGDVNAYLKAIAGSDISSKDFRTWIGSVCAARALSASGCSVSAVVAAIKQAAHRLGNTPAICRRSYVHPAVIDAATWARPLRRGQKVAGLREEEQLLLRILARRAGVKKGALKEPPTPRSSIRRSAGDARRAAP